MDKDETRRKFLQGAATAGAVAVTGCIDGGNGDDDSDENGTAGEEAIPAYEVWALDQGTDTVYVYEPDEGYAADDATAGELFDLVETIDVNEVVGDEGPIVPHMIDYSSDYAYAAVACTAGARTLIFRTEDRELVADVDTGAGSHMAAFSPDDEYVHVDAIGEEAIVRVDADLEDETFDVVDEIDLREDETVLEAGIEEGAPICHQYAHDGRSLHTLGPSYHDGALVIVDHDDFTVDRAIPGDRLPTNCGTMPHPTDETFYLTAGLPSDPEEGVEGVGDYYVYDTAADEIVVDGESTRGVDAHGFWFTPDGEELWVLNRETNDGVVVDPDTNDVVEEIEAFGPARDDDPGESDAPDIMWATPDGAYVVVTLRGPVPISGDPHASTGVTPGFSVLDVETREIVGVVEPDPIGAYDEDDLEAARADEDDAPRIPDFHGIGVVPREDFDTAIDTSPPF